MIALYDKRTNTMKMARGHFYNEATGMDYVGVLADVIGGTLLAGQNLVIECPDVNGGVTQFKVDSSGVIINNGRMYMNTSVGAMGWDAKYGFFAGKPGLFQSVENGHVRPICVDASGKLILDSDGFPKDVNVWIGIDGKAYFRGDVHADSGYFNGEVHATKGTFKGTIQASDFLDSSGNSMLTGGKWKSEWLELKGLTIKNAKGETTFKVDSNGNVVKEIEPTVVRQVISPQTSKTMCEILESVVSVGGGKNAYLAGYRIAGKTGTSEKQPRGNGKYVASFVGFAPADDPEIVCLVILDQPPVGNTYYGGLIAAPVVKNILEESLQYLGVEPEYTQEELEMIDISIPDITGKTKAEAESILKNLGMEISVKGTGDVIFDQVPKAHSKVAIGSKIVAYTEGEESKRTVTIPDVVGCYGSEANRGITNAGLNVRIKGQINVDGVAICSGQSPAAGTVVEPGTVVTLDFTYAEIRD